MKSKIPPKIENSVKKWSEKVIPHFTCFRYRSFNDFGSILTQKVDHFDKLLLAGKQTIGKGCMCKKHCKTQVILRFLHKRHRIIFYYRDVFRSKKLCLLLRRVQWQFGRLQGIPKRALGAAFVIKIRLKTNTCFWLIFTAFLRVLRSLYPTPPT